MPERRSRTVPLTILNAMEDRALFGAQFPGDSWAAWRTALAALFALPMAEMQAGTYRHHTGRSTLPTSPATEGWFIVGRRGGKSRIAACVAVFLAAFRNYDGILAPGEVGTIMLIAADRRQARTLMRYVTGLLDRVPMLAQMVTGRTAESITLSNRIVIEIHTASFRAVRGYTIVAAIADEVAFWHTDDAANPDTEILNALRPAMATVPGALLLCISSPYARRGAMWEAYKAHYAKDGDRVLVWQADTLTMNPSVPTDVIAAAYAADEAAARAEYGAEFRSDLEDYVTAEAVQRVVAPGRREVGPQPGRRYVAFCDPAGGSGSDAMTLAVAHREGSKAVLDVVAAVTPPFSPEEVTEHFAALLMHYGLRRVIGDRYAGGWPAEQFRKRGITYESAADPKSTIYAAFLPLVNSGAVELLDDRRLVAQLLGLERRTAWGGKDSIDHSPGAHDDLINSAAGALVLCAATRPAPVAFSADRATRIGEPRSTGAGIVGGRGISADRGLADYISNLYKD